MPSTALGARQGRGPQPPRPDDRESRGGPAPSPQRAFIADIAASFQEAAVEILLSKTMRACQRTGIRRLVVGGGVAANRRLHERLRDLEQSQKLQVVIPPIPLCVDNGAMVAGLGCVLLRQGKHAPLSIPADPSLHLVS